MQKKHIVIVDASSYLFRAYHAIPPLSNAAGHPTNAMYGVINMLRKLLNDTGAERFIVVFDAKGKNFRHELFPEYKANRPAMPEDLVCQIKPLHDIIRAYGLPLVCVEGIEADDLIGTLACEAVKAGHDVLISTGDKDLAQLVNEHITLVNTMTNTTLDIAGVKEKFGVRPEQIVDYLTLMGDTVDNIPGVEKVGPKTAVKWLTEYETLDNLIANADKITGKVGENLRSTLDKLPLSKQLVTIRCNLELPHHIDDYKNKPLDKEKLIHLFKEYGFKGWINDLAPEHIPAKKAHNHYELILTEEALMPWLDKIKEQKLVAFDTETTSLDYMDAELVGVSFSLKAHEAAYIPCGHHYIGAPSQIQRERLLDLLKPILEDIEIKKIGHNIKYDAHVLANYDIQIKGIAFDTMLESYVLNSTVSRHNLDALSMLYLDHKTITYEEVAGKGAKQINFSEVEINTAGNYAAEDADVTWRLHELLYPKIKAEENLHRVFKNIEMPLSEILMQMEHRGVLLDCEKLKKQSIEIAHKVKELEEKAYTLAGKVFNLSSPKQLQEILYEDLKLPVLQKTPTGQPSTAEEVLQELALNYPLPEVIIEHRMLSKLKSTYTDPLPQMVNERTGRVHTCYQQAITSTGRLSSTNPNLQNIPIRNEEGRKIRQAFIAPEGKCILAADYSQIELRIMAHLSSDEGLLNAFARGEDIHRATAAEVFSTAYTEVSSEQRRNAKAINFGLIYGMSAFGLARQLDIDRQSAQRYIDMYFERYPGVLRYMDDSKERARDLGYVETIFGRRLYLPEIRSNKGNIRKAAERIAINAPMQGSAADIIKIAMIEIEKFIKTSKLDITMVMQVHDELVFEVKNDSIEKAKDLIRQCMSTIDHLKVPLEVDIGVGDNWDEAH